MIQAISIFGFGLVCGLIAAWWIHFCLAGRLVENAHIEASSKFLELCRETVQSERDELARRVDGVPAEVSDLFGVRPGTMTFSHMQETPNSLPEPIDYPANSTTLDFVNGSLDQNTETD